ncbi:hypothetical protein [Flavobacterium sp. FlaQc-28]|uniref:hypothetical protein n=1 Tax=Flavobacterium sp. FlaQc-28 TaxID=3374178 RepID=UPI0037562F12
MKIKDLKKIVQDLPDEMPVGLLDLTTDETENMNYHLSEENFEIEDYYHEDDESTDNYGVPRGKMLFISFENKLNENSILE